MKTIKKQISVLLAVMMILCSFTAISFSASAAETTGGTITVKSNLCDSKTYNYTANDKQIEVTYYLQCDEMLLNMQGGIYYDSSVLKIADTNTAKTSIPGFAEGQYFVNFDLTNKALYNATSLNLYDFTTKGVFFTVTFDIIGSGDTEVNLDVDVITATTANSYDELAGASDIDLVYYGNIASDKFTFAGEGKLVSKPSAATIYFAAPTGKSAGNTWNGVDLYYSNSTSNLTDAKRIAMTKTNKTLACDAGSTTTLKAGDWAVYELALTAEQVAEIDTYNSIGFAKQGSNVIKTVMYGKGTSVVYSTATSGEYTTAKSSLAAFDGKTFIISGAYVSGIYENQTYTGYWSNSQGSEDLTIRFAMPMGTNKANTWGGVDLYYSNSTSNLTNANRIAMTDTGKVINCDNGSTTTLKAGAWNVYEVSITAEQAAEIDKYTSVGFAMAGSNNIKTVMYGGGKSIVYSTETSGTYSKSKSSVSEFDGKTFIISGAYGSGIYENQTYTGYWTNDQGSEGVTIRFAMPIGTNKANTWGGVDLYYTNSPSNLTNAKRIAMTDTGKVINCDNGSTTTLHSGAWNVYELTLTTDQAAEIDKYTSIGFAMMGSNNIKTVMYGGGKSIVYSTDTSGKYLTSKSSVKTFKGKTFVISGAYGSGNYENQTYTGYWTNDQGSEEITISFAMPTGANKANTWGGVDLYYTNSTSNLTNAKRITMTNTGKTVSCSNGSTTTLKSGDWSVYEVTLTATQAAEIDKYSSIGFAMTGSNNIKTVMYGGGKSIVYSTETSGEYAASKLSIKAFVGKTFVISGAHGSGIYENQTYTGYWQ